MNYFTGRPYSERFKRILAKRKELAVYERMAAFYEMVCAFTYRRWSGLQNTSSRSTLFVQSLTGTRFASTLAKQGREKLHSRCLTFSVNSFDDPTRADR